MRKKVKIDNNNNNNNNFTQLISSNMKFFKAHLQQIQFYCGNNTVHCEGLRVRTESISRHR